MRMRPKNMYPYDLVRVLYVLCMLDLMTSVVDDLGLEDIGDDNWVDYVDEYTNKYRSKKLAMDDFYSSSVSSPATSSISPNSKQR